MGFEIRKPDHLKADQNCCNLGLLPFKNQFSNVLISTVSGFGMVGFQIPIVKKCFKNMEYSNSIQIVKCNSKSLDNQTHQSLTSSSLERRTLNCVVDSNFKYFEYFKYFKYLNVYLNIYLKF